MLTLGARLLVPAERKPERNCTALRDHDTPLCQGHRDGRGVFSKKIRGPGLIHITGEAALTPGAVAW